MPKRLFILTIAFVVMALCHQTVSAEDQKGPVAAVEQREFDFKEVKEGSVLEHTFKIFNRGDEPLKIINVRPG